MLRNQLWRSSFELLLGRLSIQVFPAPFLFLLTGAKSLKKAAYASRQHKRSNISSLDERGVLISAAQVDALLSWHFVPPPPDNERSHPLSSSSSIKLCNKQFPAGEKKGGKKKEIHIGGKGIQAISCHLSRSSIPTRV